MQDRQARLARARLLRNGDNSAEAIMWNWLKAKQLGGYKFVRQFPIGPFFADFAARRQFLVVEIDGSQHVDSGYDRVRDEFMHNLGFAVLRFWSADVLRNSEGVCETILAVLDGRIQGPMAGMDVRFLPSTYENRLRTIR